MFAQFNDTKIFYGTVSSHLGFGMDRMEVRPTLIALHGGPGFDHAPMRPYFDRFADTHQVLYVDHRGNGRSTGMPDTWTLKQWGADVKALCDHLGIEKPIVFGVSFGGMVAMSYATQFPDHPGKLILASAQHAGIPQLAADIAAKGLLENLVVHPIAGGKDFEVIAGGRRLAALEHLVKTKAIAKDHAVACLVVKEASEALLTEISLSENFQHVPPHPADQFEAFAMLMADGMKLSDIASRFGITKAFVEQRLKLAAVSPRLLAEYRKEPMMLEQVMEVTPETDYALFSGFGHVAPSEAALPKKDGKRLAALSARYDNLVARAEVDEDPATIAELDVIEAELKLLQAKKEVWSDADKARSGVVISLDADGAVNIACGLIREHPDLPHGTTKAKRPRSGYPDSVLRDLAAHRTAALREMLAGSPAIAHLALLEALVSMSFNGGRAGCLDMTARETRFEHLSDSVGEGEAAKAFFARRQNGPRRFPNPMCCGLGFRRSTARGAKS